MLVIYKDILKNCYCVTPEANYNNKVVDDRQITKLKDFTSPQEIIDYFCKYMKKKPSDFIVK